MLHYEGNSIEFLPNHGDQQCHPRRANWFYLLLIHRDNIHLTNAHYPVLLNLIRTDMMHVQTYYKTIDVLIGKPESLFLQTLEREWINTFLSLIVWWHFFTRMFVSFSMSRIALRIVFLADKRNCVPYEIMTDRRRSNLRTLSIY